MKKLKCLLMALLAVLTFAACETTEDEDKEPQFFDYFDMRVTKCERVGANLKVDFTLKNITGKDVQGVALNGGTVWDMCQDDLGGKYYSEVSLSGGNWMTSVEFNMEKGASVTGSFLVEGYDATNSSKKFNLIFNGRCQSVSFDGRAEINGISVTDNRVLKNGFDTNDQVLEYKAVSCKMLSEPEGETPYYNLYFTYTVKNTSSRDISRFAQNVGGHDQVKDETNQQYNAEIALEGVDYRYSQEVTLKAGETKTYVMKVKHVRDNAKAISGYVACPRESAYPWADVSARFYDIAVQR